ncbi:MAG: protein-glutamate O-methyltransferase CheR [Bryobacteraceae bacterium]
MTQTTHASALDTESYGFLRDYIHRQSGILLDNDKHYLLEARLMPVVEELHLPSLIALCQALKQSEAPLRKKVVEAMTTHETLFFRDSTPFDAMRKELLPQLALARQTTRRLKIWCAAASSGQEPYSLAMLLLEAGFADWNIEILGTDLSEQVLNRAREGRYLQLEVNRGLPAQYLVKYFQREGLEWRIKDNIRRMVRFEQGDLRQTPRGSGYDFVFCRNVLIYFDIPTKKQILERLRASLTPGGYLALGSAESTLGLDEVFQRVVIGNARFYQAPK